MENNNKLKDIDIKNRMCYYFDDIMKVQDIDFENILLDERLYKNILIYDIYYKNPVGANPSRIRFEKVDGATEIYDGARYL